MIRVGAERHARLRDEALNLGISLNELCVQLMDRSLGVDSSSEFPLVKALKREFRSDLIAIAFFGSQVRGDARESSDIDVLIVLHSKREITRDLYRQWDRLQRESPEIFISKISPHFLSLSETSQQPTSLWLEVALDAKIIFDTEDRLHHQLLALRHEIASGKMRRKKTHGHFYWERAESE